MFFRRHQSPWFLTALILFAVSSSLSKAHQESAAASEKSANKAAKVTVTESGFEKDVASQAAPAGKAFFVLETEWTNIHPKQKIEKSKLEGKQDRTMGTGTLLGGKKKEAKEEEMVDADVAYLVPNFFDHAYILADGETYSLDKLTESVPGGISLKKGFSLPKQGDVKRVRFVYLIPENSRNIAFQFFDYSYGHILIPLKGDLKLATGARAAKPRALGEFKDSFLELAATAIDFRAEYNEEEAPEGWRYAVVKLTGKSLSSSGAEKNIVQVEPQEYIWVATKEGHLYYSSGGSTTEEGYIRFTPDFYQSQEVAFLVPAAEKEISLGMRVQNRVYLLALTTTPAALPAVKPRAIHKDGQTMEIMLFGARRDKGIVILDLGIRSLVKSGIEIQTDAQFILKAEGEDIYFDEEATNGLFHRPPTPFIIPPETFVRFKLAYRIDEMPETLYYRGYESENNFSLSKLMEP
ncbi:MAG: hypothetical protein QHH14_06135 [Clostridiales bacterium]|nr:hypothetical protein [Clostridiales bacterium]